MNENTKNIICIISFITFVFGLSIANILVPDKEVSTSERRKLAQFSSINLSNYTEKYDDYALDQFVGRDFFRSIMRDRELFAAKLSSYVQNTLRLLVAALYVICARPSFPLWRLGSQLAETTELMVLLLIPMCGPFGSHPLEKESNSTITSWFWVK